jgi:hypothetical protein
MDKIIGYHGTTNNCIDSIKRLGFIPSIKDNEWLGMGIYFFEDDFHAFKWCVDKYRKQYSDKFYIEDFKNKMGILKSDIIIQSDRIFDLDKIEYRSVFEHIVKKLSDIEECRDKIIDNPNVTCFVIDHMFRKIGLENKYDVVKNTFKINFENYKREKIKIRSAVSQVQICVKNKEVIKKPIIFDFYVKMYEYFAMWDNMIGTEDLKTRVLKINTNYNLNNTNKIKYKKD